MQRVVAEDLAAGHEAPAQLLLMLDTPNRAWWRSFDIVSPTIARVWLRGQDTSFRLVPWYPADVYSWWRIRFGPDAEGVGNAKVWGGTIPYDKIAIVYVSGRTARRLTSLDQHDVAGLEVDWARDKPVSLPGVSTSELCPLVWSADRRAIMDGWSVAERDDKGPVRWTMSRAAELSLPAACDGRSRLRVVAAYAVSQRNVEDLKLTINGQRLGYRRTMSDGNIIYEAELDPQLVAASPLLQLEIGVDQLDTPPGASRQLGIAIRRVEVLPGGDPAGKAGKEDNGVVGSGRKIGGSGAEKGK